MKITHLLALIANLNHAEYAPKDRPVQAAIAITRTLEEAPPLPFTNHPIESTARLLFVWSYYESAWRMNALGDNGQSCGPMQTSRDFVSCTRAITDPTFAYSEALRLIHTSVKKCGSIARALGQYSTGVCGGARKNVLARCRRARVNCE